jgi:hypothetical protein
MTMSDERSRASAPLEPPSEQRCTVCKQTESWHREHRPAHAFQAVGSRLEAAVYDESPTPQPMRAPFDPILRMLLIDKGLITVEELEEAERKLKAASAMGQGIVVQDRTVRDEPTPAQEWQK